QLVNAARDASAPTTPEEEGREGEEEGARDVLVKISRETVILVRVFLERADEHGVVPVLVDDLESSSSVVAAQQMAQQGEARGGGGGVGATRDGEEEEGRDPSSSGTRTRTRTGREDEQEVDRSLTTETDGKKGTATSKDENDVEIRSPGSATAAERNPFSSAAGPASDHSQQRRSTADDEEVVVVHLSSAAAVSDYLSTLHDALRSSLTGLISLVDSSPFSSSSSSLSHDHDDGGAAESHRGRRTRTTRRDGTTAIDLTREAIERVRDVLVVVERVAAAKVASSSTSEEEVVKRLRRGREGLYSATTALVDAAAAAAAARDATLQQQQQPAATENQEEEEDEDKLVPLREAARAVLLSGGECISALDRVVHSLFSASTFAQEDDDKEGSSSSSSSSTRTAQKEEQDTPPSAAALAELVLPRLRTADLRRLGPAKKEERPPKCEADLNLDLDLNADLDPEADRARSAALLSSLGRKAASLGALVLEGGDSRQEQGAALAVTTSRLNLAEEEEKEETAAPLTTSPVATTLVPAALPAPATTDLNSNVKRGSAAAAGATATSLMMRQQSTESAHSQTSSHVTNLSLSSSAALTNHTAETSPRTSLAAHNNNNPQFGTATGTKRISAASSMSNNHAALVSRPSSRNEPQHLPSLAIPARLSSNGSLRDAPMASPSLPFNYALPAPSSLSLLSPTSTSATTGGGGAAAPFSPSSSSALGLGASAHPFAATKHTSGAASSAASGGLWYLERDYEPREISFNADGHVSGGTLRCLVERMTLHDTTIDAGFSNTFLLTFRMFTTPADLARLLWARFDLSPPVHPATGAALSPEELKKWTAQKLTPVRLRVYNLFKTWVEVYWLHDRDGEIVDDLLEWTEGRLRDALPAPSKRLAELVNKRVAGAVKRSSFPPPNEFGMRLGNSSSTSFPAPAGGSGESTSGSTGGRARGLLNRMQSTDRLRQGSISAAKFTSPSFSSGGFGHQTPSPSPDPAATARIPAPSISKNLIAALRPALSGRSPLLNSVAELDPLELARQLTIMESRIYCSIRPEELLAAATSGSDSASCKSPSSADGPAKAVQSVRQMSALSTRLTGWIAETILNEHDQKRRTGLVKFFIKLGNNLLELGNYNALFAVFTALSSSTISRLQKTWDGLAPKYRATFETLRKATDHTRNYAEYRQRVRQALPPCLPFVGLFLTDLIFVYEGNRAERVSPADPDLSLINFDRYHKMARVVGELQRFQSPYALVEVPELQAYLAQELDTLKIGQDAQSLYRQSLMIEPRQGETPSSSAASFVSSHSSHRPGRELLNWRG
ncbi:hypothetical protein C6P46_005110, partial [Rhodotorula mucilaginosa]